ncbi:MAG: sialate O-acetylesterase [Verrucomicrobiota bacterium]|jgi:sialate O-acetylesterase|nr:sialate O-acetylesterase [Verrucomicrobiota bacterium]
MGKPLTAFFTIAILLCVANTRAAVRTARIFSDHMVLQRELPVPIWGRADAGKMVAVQFAGQTTKTQADHKGNWKVWLKPLKASSNGRELKVNSGKDSTLIRDVLVGEVWFAGGQSNMGYTVRGMARRLPEGKVLANTANFNGIRYRKITEKDSLSPKDDLTGGSWVVCTPKTVHGFSGVGFVYARRLHLELKVPIGIIDCAWGGTPIEPYIPIEAFTGHPTLKRLAKLAKAGDIESIKKMRGGTFVRSPAWLAGAIYNGRIAPLAPYAIRGAIWYQAESNCGIGEDPRDYAHKMRSLISGWRNAWNHPNLPFYYVQLPQWRSYAWTYAREEQRRAMDVPNTGMAVTIDLDNHNDIHPPNKIDVGERLARWPLAKVYSHKIHFSGPLFRAMKIKREVIHVEFDRVGEGLMIGKAGVGRVTELKDGTLNGFEVSDKTGAWHTAKAIIQGKSVMVRSAAVKEPTAVRYACHPQAPKNRPWNLYNKEGLPASPFCSDWSRMPYNPQLNLPHK